MANQENNKEYTNDKFQRSALQVTEAQVRLTAYAIPLRMKRFL